MREKPNLFDLFRIVATIFFFFEGYFFLHLMENLVSEFGTYISEFGIHISDFETHVPKSGT